ncbi:hypothetical protein [Streptomyces winkii]|uniref:hypothetical protein n=1 Tax=Streptomyces winkii TaxID=3051178 RepID=UPI0028D5FD40|nr:hypothetical protein [Streptomyces sp. DSM 40971]
MTGHAAGSSRPGAVAVSKSRGPRSGHGTDGPRADCTADRAGGLTFDVRLTDRVPESGVPEPPREAAMLLRLRGGERPEDTVRLPLDATASDGVLRAELPGSLWLPEGRWDACLALDGEEPRRLLPGVHDLRSLVDRVPSDALAWVGVRIPYATKYGNLTVRSWLRRPHAEAGPLHVAEGAMHLRGTLYGARLSATACLEVHPRHTAEAPVTVPVFPDGGAVYGYGGDRAPGTAVPERAHGFTVWLPLDALPPGEQAWDLWLRPRAGEEPVRLARILDDVPDKKQIFSYPPQRVTGRDGAARSVRPYYTLDNDLSVRVSCTEPG